MCRDFVVKLSGNRVVVAETKAREEIDLPQKMQRLRQWCDDVNLVSDAAKYDFAYVDEESFRKYKPRSFTDVLKSFREYRN